MAAIAALAFVLAAALARRLVPEPWATAGRCSSALSPPALAVRGDGRSPSSPAGALLCGAVLLRAAGARARRACATPTAARRCSRCCRGWSRSTSSRAPGRASCSCAGRAGAAGGCVALGVGRGDGRPRSSSSRRSTTSLYGGFTPYSAADPGEPATARDAPADYLERAPRLVGPVARPRRRAAALGARPRAGVLRGLAAVALAPRAPGRPAPGAPGRRDRRRARRSRSAAATVAVAAFGAPTLPAPGSRAGTRSPRCPARRRSPPGGCATRRAPGRCSAR